MNKYYISFIVFLSFIIISKSENYISNGDFENTNNIDGWNKNVNCKRTTETSHSGDYSMYCKDENPSEFTSVYRYCKDITPGLRYNVSAWIKLKNVQNGNLMIYVENHWNYKSTLYSYSNKIEECKNGN